MTTPSTTPALRLYVEIHSATAVVPSAASWQIDKHQALEFGWAHLWPGGFIDQTGDNDEADLIYLQYVFTF